MANKVSCLGVLDRAVQPIPYKDNDMSASSRIRGTPYLIGVFGIRGTPYLIVDTAKTVWLVFQMARIARVVAPGMPHHVTQRGNRRQQTFFTDEDYQAYLELMSE